MITTDQMISIDIRSKAWPGNGSAWADTVAGDKLTGTHPVFTNEAPSEYNNAPGLAALTAGNALPSRRGERVGNRRQNRCSYSHFLMTTYYLKPDTGDDADPGTSLGSEWATLQHALDTMVAGDELRCINSATETTASIVGVDTNAGSPASGYIRVIGADSSGDPLTSGYYHLQASASIANLLNFTSLGGRVRFERIDFDGNSNVTGDLLNLSASGAGPSCVFVSCRMHGAGATGANCRGAGIKFFDCDVYDCDGRGIRSQSTSSSRWTYGAVIGCRIFRNGGDGIGQLGAGRQVVSFNEIYDNDGDGIGIDAPDNGELVIEGNTIFGNGGSAMYIASGDHDDFARIINNSLSGSAAYGINFLGSTDPLWIAYNHFDGNTSGATNYSGGISAFGPGNITGSANFANTTVESEDFTPETGSVLFGAGMNGAMIGCKAPLDGGGGGGGNTSVFGTA